MPNQFPEITQEQKNAIHDAIQRIKDSLPKLPVIETDELKRMPKMDNNRTPFVTKAFDLAKGNSDLLPPFNNLEEDIAHLALRIELDSIESMLADVNQIVDELRARTGSKSYVGALGIYDMAKKGAKKGIASMVAAAAQLKVFFEYKTHPDKSKSAAKKSTTNNQE